MGRNWLLYLLMSGHFAIFAWNVRLMAVIKADGYGHGAYEPPILP